MFYSRKSDAKRALQTPPVKTRPRVCLASRCYVTVPDDIGGGDTVFVTERPAHFDQNIILDVTISTLVRTFQLNTD